LEELGSGALSTVYKASQEPLGRTVAVKALKSTVATQSRFAAHLEREAGVLAEMGHPNIVGLFDFVKTDLEMYLVLEYVEGPSLEDLLARRTPLPPEMVAAVGAEAARGLDHAHERGVVHRNVNPGNILLSLTGGVKLVDFGIAQQGKMRMIEETVDHRDPGAFGTPAYMSPEQILGEFVDARSDIFSLGVVLYEMLAGVRPFEREGPSDRRAAAQRIRRDPPRPIRACIPEIPRALDRIVMRALEKLPVDRFTSSAALASELEEFVRAARRGLPRALIARALKDAGLMKHGASFSAATDDPPESTSHALRPTLVVLTGLSILLAVGGFAIQWSSHDGAARASPDDGRVELVPFDAASLRVNVTPWADVSIDGRYVETTPFAKAISLPAGTHYVKFHHPEAEPETRIVTLAPGQAARLEVALRMKGGTDPQIPSAAKPPRDVVDGHAPASGAQ
jgi:serine/threonine-protein kinase